MIRIKGQKIDLDFKYENIEADPQHLQSMIHRALHNATRFGLAQSAIQIKTDQNEAYNSIEIQNEGPQISQNILDKIIKPFTLDENVMNHSIGMGLGLTICQTLTKAHNGYLKIANTGQGVSVKFFFPINRKTL
jgi:K+-sensing histidine kinase KdpD